MVSAVRRYRSSYHAGRVLSLVSAGRRYNSVSQRTLGLLLLYRWAVDTCNSEILVSVLTSYRRMLNLCRRIWTFLAFSHFWFRWMLALYQLLSPITLHFLALWSISCRPPARSCPLASHVDTEIVYAMPSQHCRKSSALMPRALQYNLCPLAQKYPTHNSQS